MKSLICTLLLLITSAISLFAQPTAVREFERKYDREDDITTVTINGTMIQFAGWVASFSDEEDEDLEEDEVSLHCKEK